MVRIYLPGRPLLELLINIYINLANFFMLYLLAILIWMILNISWVLYRISYSSYINLLKLNLLNADKAGGLKPIKKTILWFCVYYFLMIGLAALTYLVPRGLPLYDTLYLILLWIIGVGFFLWSWLTIRRILTRRFEDLVS